VACQAFFHRHCKKGKKAMKKQNKPLIIVTIIACVVAAGLIMGLTRKKVVAPLSTVINTANQPTLGQANAPVSVVVFEDLKCPVCAEFNKAIFPKVIKPAIDEGKIKYTMITLAFIPGSIPAGNAALCLYKKDKNYFFPFVDYLFQHQGDESKDWATVPTLLSFARNAIPSLSSADQEELSRCISAGTYTSALADNLAIAEKAMPSGVGTPTIYINGKMVRPLSVPN
jgi:protein-disulfide isomerase